MSPPAIGNEKQPANPLPLHSAERTTDNCDNCPEETADKYEPIRDALRSNSANPSSSASQHGFYFILNQILTNGDGSLHYHFIYTREMQDTLHGQQLELLSLLGSSVAGVSFCGLLKLHANGKHPSQMLTGNDLTWHTKVSSFLWFLKTEQKGTWLMGTREV